MNTEKLGNDLVKIINDLSNDSLTVLRIINIIINNASLRSSKDRLLLEIIRPHIKTLRRDLMQIKTHETELQELEIAKERESITILEQEIATLKRGEIK